MLRFGRLTTALAVVVVVVVAIVLLSPRPAYSYWVNVGISSPTNGATFTAGSNITIDAGAASVTPISSLSVYAYDAATNSSVLVGKVTYPIYCASVRCYGSLEVSASFTWDNVPAGSYALTAVANGVTSLPVNITVY